MRIGIDAGDPVEDSNDLFGTTVQKAARICQNATPEAIFISEAVHAHTGDRFAMTGLGERTLKGFGDAVQLYEVAWR